MTELELPEGTYFSLCGLVTPGTAGQTRALLMRNRLFATRAGVAPIILTFDRQPNYPHVRQVLRDRGELVDPMQLVNIFEWYREADLDDLPTIGDGLPEVEGYDPVDTLHPDGSVYYTQWVHPRSGGEIITDFKRADGSVYLRQPTGPRAKNAPATDVILVNRRGELVGRWPKLMGWRQNWIKRLTPEGDRTFIISDSRSAINYILPMPGDDTYVLYVMHNTHNTGNWNAKIYSSFTTLLNQIHNLDGFVTLTARQGEDVAMRFGATTNMFVVPNPVEIPERPDPLPTRDRAQFSMVCRLEPQKQVDAAVRVFERVLKDEPDAKLDIFGDGSMRLGLEELILERGLEDSIRLRGHDPAARGSLLTATGFLVTSKFEGFPLATLESLSYGCPIVAYDVKYGVREQVTDGVDGYLLSAGDEQGMADRIVTMIRNPALVSRMSDAAFEKAHHHDHNAFLRDWRRVLNEVVRRKDRRTSLESVTLKVDHLGAEKQAPPAVAPVTTFAGRVVAHADRIPVHGRLAAVTDRLASKGRAMADGPISYQSGSTSFRANPRMRFVGKLTVKATSRRGTLDEAVVTLDAVSDGIGTIVPIELTTRLRGQTFEVAATFDPKTLFAPAAKRSHVMQLRLRIVWNNSSWETYVKRPSGGRPPYELSFGPTGEAVIWRGLTVVHTGRRRPAPRDDRRSRGAHRQRGPLPLCSPNRTAGRVRPGAGRTTAYRPPTPTAV